MIESPVPSKINIKNGFIVGGIAGFVGGLARSYLYPGISNIDSQFFEKYFMFGLEVFCIFMPLLSPVTGALSIFVVNLFVNKSKPNYLVICSVVGFLAGFLPFLYFMMF